MMVQIQETLEKDPLIRIAQNENLALLGFLILLSLDFELGLLRLDVDPESFIVGRIGCEVRSHLCDSLFARQSVRPDFVPIRT